MERKQWSIEWESNPRPQLGRLVYWPLYYRCEKMTVNPVSPSAPTSSGLRDHPPEPLRRSNRLFGRKEQPSERISTCADTGNLQFNTATWRLRGVLYSGAASGTDSKTRAYVRALERLGIPEYTLHFLQDLSL